MYIVFIAAEMAPVAKVGGLADVILGLSRELLCNGQQVDIFLPKYPSLHLDTISPLVPEGPAFPVHYGDTTIEVTAHLAYYDNLKIHFLDLQNGVNYFNRNEIYGYNDDAERFTCFSLACLEFLSQRSLKPDILHIHDWQTAIIAPLMKHHYSKKGLTNTKTLLTIHNLSYQGTCSPEILTKVRLPLIPYAETMADPWNDQTINLLKGGIIYADFVNTVSPNYAHEILTQEYGASLQKTLLENVVKLAGIINGIDYLFWNPQTDPFIKYPFSADNFEGKKANKRALQEQMGLEISDKPIISCVTRLVYQKGIDLIEAALWRTLEKGGQFILLGTSPAQEINDRFLAIKRSMQDNKNLKLIVEYSDILSHPIYAGSDMIIVPSLFEPCGLSQLIGLRYGAVPIVRKTGGLADTVKDVTDFSVPMENRNGYTFDHIDKESLYFTLDRAIHDWYHEPKAWKNLVIKGMKMDFSWKLSTEEYMIVYQRLIET